MHARPTAFLVTCEHASDAVPAAAGALLQPYLARVEEHQIFDRGTRAIGEELARGLAAPVFAGSCTRLAIDLNRSLDHPHLFAPPLREADPALRAELVAEFYRPFRAAVEAWVETAIEDGADVVHLSVHSFTPVFFGTLRTVDFGVLFDPERASEGRLAEDIRRTFEAAHPALRARFNEPYLGTDDGHTTALRQRFPTHYAGIELEYSHGLPLDAAPSTWAAPILAALRKSAPPPDENPCDHHRR